VSTTAMKTDRYPIPEFLRRPPVEHKAKERPIIFSAPMIRSLLAGTKTQTRRHLYTIRKFSTTACFHRDYPPPHALTPVGKLWAMTDWRHAKPGDRLYVRENSWERPERTRAMMRDGADTWPPFIYDADYHDGIPWEERDNLKTWGWKRRPSIHLPRKGSRILLEITEVRVERLQDISEADAESEGIQRVPVGKLITFTVPGTDIEKLGARAAYEALWVSINGRESWDANPYVWKLVFRRITP